MSLIFSIADARSNRAEIVLEQEMEKNVTRSRNLFLLYYSLDVLNPVMICFFRKFIARITHFVELLSIF